MEKMINGIKRGAGCMIKGGGNNFVTKVNLPSITTPEIRIPRDILPDIKIPKIKTSKTVEIKIPLPDLKLVEKSYKIHIENIERTLKNMERIHQRLKDLPQ